MSSIPVRGRTALEDLSWLSNFRGIGTFVGRAVRDTQIPYFLHTLITCVAMCPWIERMSYVHHRSVTPEILDSLPPDDRQAQRSRRELRLINRVMGIVAGFFPAFRKRRMVQKSMSLEREMDVF